LLCNGIVIFEDTGELLPDGALIAPHRPTDLTMDRPVYRVTESAIVPAPSMVVKHAKGRAPAA
jgi:hypothetical protein